MEECFGASLVGLHLVWRFVAAGATAGWLHWQHQLALAGSVRLRPTLAGSGLLWVAGWLFLPGWLSGPDLTVGSGLARSGCLVGFSWQVSLPANPSEASTHSYF